MARPLRVEYPGAFHHAFSRANSQQNWGSELEVKNWGSNLRLTLVEKCQKPNVDLTLNLQVSRSENDGVKFSPTVARFKRGLKIEPRCKAKEHTLYVFARVWEIHDHRKNRSWE